MIEYEVQDVVCDYGVFENGELIPQLILNSRRNAITIARILNADVNHRVLALEEERKHAHWIYKKRIYEGGKHYDIYKCSHCHAHEFLRIGLRPKKFCGDCGSIMDEVTNRCLIK